MAGLLDKPVGDIDLREFIAVLRLDLYKYRGYHYLDTAAVIKIDNQVSVGGCLLHSKILHYFVIMMMIR